MWLYFGQGIDLQTQDPFFTFSDFLPLSVGKYMYILIYFKTNPPIITPFKFRYLVFHAIPQQCCALNINRLLNHMNTSSAVDFLLMLCIFTLELLNSPVPDLKYDKKGRGAPDWLSC